MYVQHCMLLNLSKLQRMPRKGCFLPISYSVISEIISQPNFVASPFFSFFFFPTWNVLHDGSFINVITGGGGGWGEELRKKVDKFFQLSWSHNWFCQFTKMLEMLPLYLKLLWEIVSVSKISLGLETWVVCHVRHISCSSSLLFERRSESTLAIC